MKNKKGLLNHLNGLNEPYIKNKKIGGNMLSKQLQKIKLRLEKQTYLSSAEKELLEELKRIDRLLSEHIEFSERGGDVIKALGGPSDSCPCCGRNM